MRYEKTYIIPKIKQILKDNIYVKCRAFNSLFFKSTYSIRIFTDFWVILKMTKFFRHMMPQWKNMDMHTTMDMRMITDTRTAIHMVTMDIRTMVWTCSHLPNLPKDGKEHLGITFFREFLRLFALSNFYLGFFLVRGEVWQFLRRKQ